MKVTDEMLMACADGELDGDTLADVQRSVAADPELARRLESFERSRHLAKAAFGGALEEPVPERLLRDLQRKGRFQWVHQAYGAGWSFWPAGVLTLASVAGAALGIALTVIAATPTPELAPSGRQLATLLEASPSGEARPLPEGTGLFEATASYVVPDGVCRAFRLSPEARAAPGWRGVACRQEDAQDGAWRVQVLAATPPAAASSAYAPASDPATGSIDAFLDAIGAGEALDANEERARREGGWLDAAD